MADSDILVQEHNARWYPYADQKLAKMEGWTGKACMILQCSFVIGKLEAVYRYKRTF